MSRSNAVSDLRLFLRRHLRFSLKTFLAVFTAFALLMGFTVSKVRRQERAVAFLEENGGQFTYDYQVLSSSPATGGLIYFDPVKSMPGPDWLRDGMGEHYFISPIRLGFLRGNVSVQVVERLADLPSLESLSFRQSDLTEESLSSMPRLRQLQYLTIESSIHAEENKVVQDYSFLNKFPNLRVLSLPFSAFDDDETAHLVDGGALVRLDLGDTAIGDEGLRTMKLRDIVLLDLARTKVTDVGLSYLDSLSELQYLDLNGTAITDDGLVHLNAFQKLRRLTLIDTPITDESVKHLVKMKSLTQLDLISTSISVTGIQTLYDSLPNCRIRVAWGKWVRRQERGGQK